MSMNLHFKVKGGAGFVDFPFQTPTTLSYAVLAESDREKRLKLIREYLGKHAYTVKLIREIRELMENPNLELTVL